MFSDFFDPSEGGRSFALSVKSEYSYDNNTETWRSEITNCSGLVAFLSALAALFLSALPRMLTQCLVPSATQLPIFNLIPIVNQLPIIGLNPNPVQPNINPRPLLPTVTRTALITVTQPPVVVTQPPVVVTQPPIVVTQPPVFITQPPVFVTQPPVFITQSTVFITQPTVVITQPAVTVTQTPIVGTLPPPADTGAPNGATAARTPAPSILPPTGSRVPTFDPGQAVPEDPQTLGSVVDQIRRLLFPATRRASPIEGTSR